MDSIAGWFFDACTGLGTAAQSGGLFVAGILDSSLLSLPEINDALIFYFSRLSPRHAGYYVLASALGSIVGSLLLNRLASSKGPSWVERIVPGGRFGLGLRLYQRYGTWTLVVPALLPPPCPYKIFVLTSGALGMPLRRFLVAVTVGRSLRYSLGAVLAIKYGEQGLRVLQTYYPHLLGGVAVAALVVLTLAVKRFVHPIELGEGSR